MATVARTNQNIPRFPDNDPTLLARLAALKSMPVVDLKAEWRRLFGAGAPNAPARSILIPRRS